LIIFTETYLTTMDETVIMIRHTFFWGRESSSFMLVFLSSRYKCRLLHFSLQMCSFLHRLILKSVFVEKKCRKCSSSTSKVDCHKMMLMIRRASRDPGRDFTMNGNAIFSDLLYLLNLVIRNNIVIYVLQTSFC